MLIQVSKKLKKLSKILPSDLYVVGGYVRNSLIGIRVNDVDITSALTIDKVIDVLKNTEFTVKVKNLNTGTLLITSDNEKYEYTSFRREEYNEGGAHLPCQVVFTNSIREDAQRRDFSINAIYYNVTKDELIDYYQGIIDTKQKIVKTVETPEYVFSHDGERILRMIRFACELNFKIEENTLKKSKNYVKNIKDISGTRKFDELEKILYSDTKYSLAEDKYLYGLKLLNKLNIWQTFGLPCFKVKYKMVKKVRNKLLGLILDIVNTVKPENVKEFLDKLLKENFQMNNKKYEQTIHILSSYYDALKKLDNKQYFFKYFDCFLDSKPLISATSKYIANKYSFFYNYILTHHLVINISDLSINGNDITKRFPKLDKKLYSKILDDLLNKVFDCKIDNSKEELLNYIKENYVEK